MLPVERVVTVHSMNLVLCFVTTYSPGDGIVVLELQEKPVFQSRQLDELKYSWWNIHFKCLKWNKNREINLFSHIQLPNKLHDWESAHFKVTNMIKCIYIYIIYMVSQILTNVKEITLVTWMLPARTPTDPLCVNASLDLVEMAKTAQVNLIFLV